MIYAVICTRDRNNVSSVTDSLIKYLTKADIQVKLLSSQKSIFSAYDSAIKHISPEDNDMIMFLHDDIEILEEPMDLKKTMKDALSGPGAGFLGPAGTTYLGEDAVWWNHENWKKGLHRGRVFHVDKKTRQLENTMYGFEDDVVVLDGLFLACSGKVAKAIDFSKPAYFEGDWDFYDIHYTTQAFEKGYRNMVRDMQIVHHSRGELVGRDSWHKNRQEYIKRTDLPLQLEPRKNPHSEE